MAYLLDANVFIAAKNLHYGFDFCPAFWDWLVARSADETVLSVEKVGDEIAAIGDDLSAWAAARGPRFFRSADPALFPALRAVAQWATGQTYEPAAIATFLQAADYYLVAAAYAEGHTIVTHEVPSASVRKIKIPDACIGLGVRCVTPYAMLRHERARFVLGVQTPAISA